MKEIKNHRIIIVSDGTGETAAQMVHAALVQFGDQGVYLTRYKNIRNKAQIQAICEDASKNHNLLIYTIVSQELRSFLINQASLLTFPCIDLLGPLLVGIANYFGYEPKSIAGLLHDVNETYYKRIAAMEYTISHDDGKNLSHLDQADLMILGISRTSKTPLSMYLSHQGWKVANVPLITDFHLPKEIFEINQKKIIGLTIDAENLAMIRKARLERLGQLKNGEYADLDKVNQEIEYANSLFRKNKKWTIFNVTGKALEETASEIIKLMAARKLTPSHILESH